MSRTTPVKIRLPSITASPTARSIGKRRPVLAAGDDLPADADDSPLAGPDVTAEVLVVLLLVRRRHEQLDVAADHLGRGEPEQPLGRRVERLDDASFVDGDEGIDGRVEDGTEPGLAGVQSVRRAVIGVRTEPHAVTPRPSGARTEGRPDGTSGNTLAVMIIVAGRRGVIDDGGRNVYPAWGRCRDWPHTEGRRSGRQTSLRGRMPA